MHRLKLFTEQYRGPNLLFDEKFRDREDKAFWQTPGTIQDKLQCSQAASKVCGGNAFDTNTARDSTGASGKRLQDCSGTTRVTVFDPVTTIAIAIFEVQAQVLYRTVRQNMVHIAQQTMFVQIY